MPALPNLQFSQICLVCQRPNSSLNYSCGCSDEPWTKEYRILDVICSFDSEQREQAIRGLANYDMHHPSGILQYIFTPHTSHYPNLPFRIGLTPLLALDNLSEDYEAKIFLKNEGDNPSGCFKDRETIMAALHSKATGQDKAVIYSSGNAAASAALLASEMNFGLITCVAGDTYSEKVHYIRKKGSDVIRIGGPKTTFEEGYRLFARLNEDGVFSGLGYDNWSVRNPYRIIGDKTTAIEIIKQYEQQTGKAGAVPDYVVVPTGNGSCLAGIWRGFQELRSFGLIDTLPKMVSAAIKHASPVYKAWQKNRTHRPAVCDLDQVSESEKEIGSIILAEEGYDSIEATKAVFESGGLAMVLTKSEMKSALIDLMTREKDTVLHHNVLPEPASIVSLASIKKMKQQGITDSNTAVVALLSGHGAKSKKLLLNMLRNHPDLRMVMKRIIDNKKSQLPDIKGTRFGTLVDVGKDFQEIKDAFHKLDNQINARDLLTV